MKLTTKLALIFLVLTVLFGVGLGLLGIPFLRRALEQRERNYAASFLEREAQLLMDRFRQLRLDARARRLTDQEVEQAREQLLGNLDESFAKFYFHSSGRLFVLDADGRVVVSSDPTKNGRTVSNLWVYKDDALAQLHKALGTSLMEDSKGPQTRQFDLQEIDERQGLVPKSLFVSYLPQDRYYVCISVDEEDLYYTARWISTSLLLVLAIVILVFFLLFHFFYSQLRKRYETIVEHAQLIASGNYDVVIGDRAADEMGMLAATIDKLAANLRLQRTLESQLRQAQKMEMVGTLASGIAHDFNNTLGGMMSAIDLIGQELRSPATPGKPDLELIRNTVQVASDCANRGKETVEQLLTFSRMGESHKQLADLNQLVRNVKAICLHSFDKRIVVTVETPAEKSVVKADRSQLEQAILNVCINARDAMPDGGELLMRVTRENRARHEFTGQLAESPICHLLIRDSGIGMDKETLARVFEPFFTTKKKGTGLGLAMVYKIVDEHHGWIEVDSRIGQGTAFSMCLPCATGTLPADEPDRPARKEAAPKPSLAQGKETIMVVDDDQFMLQMTEDILTRLGYRSLTATDGQAAIDLFQARHAEIDLVLLDLMLPKVSGDAVFEQIRKVRPGMAVLLISGFKRDPRIADLIARGCDGFLNKPYSIEELANAIRATLDRPKPPA